MINVLASNMRISFTNIPCPWLCWILYAVISYIYFNKYVWILCFVHAGGCSPITSMVCPQHKGSYSSFLFGLRKEHACCVLALRILRNSSSPPMMVQSIWCSSPCFLSHTGLAGFLTHTSRLHVGFPPLPTTGQWHTLHEDFHIVQPSSFPSHMSCPCQRLYRVPPSSYQPAVATLD